MDAHELRKTLAEVHEELQQANAVDEAPRELLVSVLHDIERILAQRESADEDASTAEEQSEESMSEASASETGGVLGALRQSVHHFEDTHPFLASLIGRIADGLSNMGI